MLKPDPRVGLPGNERVFINKRHGRTAVVTASGHVFFHGFCSPAFTIGAA